MSSETNGAVGSEKSVNFDDENDGSDDSVDLNSFSSDSDARDSAEVSEFDEQKAVRSIANLICYDEFPPQMVESIHFRGMIELLNPQFKPSFDSVGSECMKVYKERKVETEKFLRNFDGRISLSMDILRHESGSYYTLRCDDYFCLSAHFIDENWKMKKWVLNFRCLWRSGHSADYIPEGDDLGIFRLLEDWGIENKISTLTRNNEGCYDPLVLFVKSHIQDKKELQLNGQLFRVHCCGDMIKTMVEDAFETIEDIIDKVRELYSFGRSLPLWYLTTSKLKGALELWSMGEFSSQDVIDDYDVPSPEEWKKVEGVCKIADKMYEVSNALFETKHLTANVYLYHLDELREILSQFSTDSDDFVRTIAKDMWKKFDKYWDDMFLLLAISAALDPRFKMKYIEFVCSKVKGMDGNSQVAAVLGAINKLFDEYVIGFPEKGNFSSQSSSSDSDSDSDSEGESPTAGRVHHTFSVVQDYQQFLQLSDQPAKKSDLHCYLEDPVLPWSQDFDALTWWSTAGANYPTLSRMARDFLAIPVSVASSFKAFYTEPRPADGRVVCLKPELMNALVCTRSWYSKY